MISILFGLLGIWVNVVIYQQNTGKKLLLYKLFSNVLWSSHYFTLNATAAGTIAAINVFRETVFFNQHKKWASGKLWLLFFILCSIVSAIVTWRSIFSVFPTIASILSIISFWKSKPGLSRILVFPISAFMMIYDIYCMSYIGIINECFTIFSAVAGIIRYSKAKTLQS